MSQLLFFTMFLWFCIVSTVGEQFHQIRSWPVNLILQLDPLVALGTILSTHTLYWPLLWALATVILTILFGRFFCGFVCPFGTIHHFVGYLGRRLKRVPRQIELNKYRRAQCIKYFILVFLLAMAAFPSIASTLQIGLLDPIPLVTRSTNLVLVAALDKAVNIISVPNRFYDGAWIIFTVFLTAVLLNLAIPRFYCRFVCPLGALFGILGRYAIWRIGKKQDKCINCKLCEKSCEGGCEPAGHIRTSECVLCFNCLDDCKHELIAYQTKASLAGEITNPDISRRGFAISLASGVFAAPVVRLGAQLADNWHHGLIRPPGAIAEEEFLKRCIKCGQCMRVCPTNVLQPAGFQYGLEAVWTPVLNNRIGSSGCQMNCTACGQICPTSAIRPITLREKLGVREFAEAGPVRMGTAFFDRNRCLPWAMDKPCIVCEENCPVSPKAIYTREIFETVREGLLTVDSATKDTIEIKESNMIPSRFATGDYYGLLANNRKRRIIANTEQTLEFSPGDAFDTQPENGEKLEIQVRLQRPYVDIDRCIGCGICEHECPVSGKKAISISAVGETRSNNRRLSPGSHGG